MSPILVPWISFEKEKKGKRGEKKKDKGKTNPWIRSVIMVNRQ